MPAQYVYSIYFASMHIDRVFVKEGCQFLLGEGRRAAPTRPVGDLNVSEVAVGELTIGATPGGG